MGIHDGPQISAASVRARTRGTPALARGRNSAMKHRVSEAQRRSENSGLWFSPEPEGPQVKGARNPDSVLFELSKITAPVNPIGPAARWHGRSDRSSGSGLIDVRTLVDAARDPSGGAPPPPPLLLTPRLVPPHAMVAPISATPASAPRPVLWAIVGLLATLVALLGVLALG